MDPLAEHFWVLAYFGTVTFLILYQTGLCECCGRLLIWLPFSLWKVLLCGAVFRVETEDRSPESDTAMTVCA